MYESKNFTLLEVNVKLDKAIPISVELRNVASTPMESR